MAEDNFTLTTFYSSWQAYQERIKAALASLKASQLALRPAPHLRSIGENALHIVGCRAYWFIGFMGEDVDSEMKVYMDWNEMSLSPEPPPVPSAAELVRGLESSWQFMADRLDSWGSAEMQQTFPDEWDGKRVDVPRAGVVWHVLEHDLYHGGEISLTLGMHGLTGIDL